MHLRNIHAIRNALFIQTTFFLLLFKYSTCFLHQRYRLILCKTDMSAVFTESTVPRNNQQNLHQSQNNHIRYQSSSQLYMSSSPNQQFDITRPVFDLLSLRSIRGDAIIRYDSLNQSEPLRITLFGLICIICLLAPNFTIAVGYDPMSLSTTVVCIVSAIISGGLFVRECQQRTKQLSRIEKELNTENLPIRLPTNKFADMPFGSPTTLKELRSTTTTSTKQPPRIIAICGNEEKLTEALNSIAIYRQRLTQAAAFVVAVPTDKSTSGDWQVLDKEYYKSWLADSYLPQVWLDYFKDLSGSNSNDSLDDSFRWFGLTARGQSWGSGQGDIPSWLQILGQFLRPTDFLDVSDENTATSNSSSSSSNNEIQQDLLVNVQTFYHALTTGDQKSIEELFSKTLSNEVTEVISAGGRIDPWTDCLADGARPSDMQTSGIDATLLSDNEACTTLVEFPANTGIDSASLLAVQRWTRSSTNDPWKLTLHQTIPWSLETKAQGTLRCDCRGCVALTRGAERRTFGGIIG